MIEEAQLHSIDHIIPSLKSLTRIEKLRVVQFLVTELAVEEETAQSILHANEYPIWSPFEAHDAAPSSFLSISRTAAWAQRKRSPKIRHERVGRQTVSLFGK